MARSNYSEADAQAFAALPPRSQKEFLGRQLEQMVGDGDAQLTIVAALDTSLRDYIIQAHNELHGERLLSWGPYGTAALSIGFAGGTIAAGNSWWGTAIVGLMIFFLVGYFVARYTTTLAITRLVSVFYGHFEFLWDAKVLSVKFSNSDEVLDSRTSNDWHDSVQSILGLKNKK
ncbi:hypothetical protein ACEN9F_10950 [Duganella sp. CT11-25]|uniref:hypothetical protein n=1 Tax=unclassified Duganella TaxID=2636909 RepID=UPI0039AF63E5